MKRLMMTAVAIVLLTNAAAANLSTIDRNLSRGEGRWHWLRDRSAHRHVLHALRLRQALRTSAAEGRGRLQLGSRAVGTGHHRGLDEGHGG